MSADNGIYIAKFPDGFRVAYSSAIENVDYYRKGSKKRKEALKNYFGKSQIYETKKEADDYAVELEKEVEEINKDLDFFYIEYGICFIGEYESF